MNSFVKAMGAAKSGMNAQGMRMRVVSENIANIETPGYRRKLLSFGSVFNPLDRTATARLDRAILDQSALETRYEPAHPMADEGGYVEMSNVNLVVEMADAREAGRSYEANLATFQQARQMYASLLDLLKR